MTSDTDQSGPQRPTPGPELPLVLVTLAVALMSGFQTVQLLRQHADQQAALVGQEAAVQKGLKVRQQLQALSRPTAQLAAAGNLHAKQVIETLRGQGLTIDIPVH